MTFAIVARDASGAFGAAVCSSSPAVAARCLHLRDGAGAVSSQNVTDPRLGSAVLDRLEAGEGAADALLAITDGTEHIAYRQLLVVGSEGLPVVYSGANALGIFGEAIGPDAAAGGNLLATPAVPQAMVDAFHAADGDLERRLLTAMEAGRDAGGEAGPVHSAGLAVVRGAGWRVTDLRVDWTDGDPIAALGDLLERWMPQRDDYVSRGLNPAAAPSYGVPGDE